VAHSYIKEVNLCVDKLNIIKGQVSTAIDEREKQLSAEIDDLTDTVLHNQQKTKLILEQLQASVKEAKEEVIIYFINGC
jgi:hypothetical protein